MSIDKSTPILVTGGNGYIASWLIKYLMEDGYTVRATVRSLSDKKKYQHLLDISKKTSGSLEMLEADLLVEGSFDQAVKGCQYVMHTASPFILDVKDAQKELVDPALKGTRNVLNAVNKSGTVKRVVLTSSVASVFGDSIECTQKEGKIFNESDWNTTSTLVHQPYAFSKVLAEKAAWEMNKVQNKWDMVTINPGFVLGPSLTAYSSSESIKIMKDILKGKLMFGVPDLNFGYVDVRDVAKAHIKAAFSESAKGRYITVAKSDSFIAMANAVRNKYGKKVRLPKSIVPKWLLMIVGPTQGLTRQYIKNNVGYPLNFDNRKIRKELNFNFRSLEQTILDHADQIMASRLK